MSFYRRHRRRRIHRFAPGGRARAPRRARPRRRQPRSPATQQPGASARRRVRRGRPGRSRRRAPRGGRAWTTCSTRRRFRRCRDRSGSVTSQPRQRRRDAERPGRRARRRREARGLSPAPRRRTAIRRRCRSARTCRRTRCRRTRCRSWSASSTCRCSRTLYGLETVTHPLLQRVRPAAGSLVAVLRRDLAVRHGAARGVRRRSTATASRRATSPTSPTSSTACCARARRRRERGSDQRRHRRPNQHHRAVRTMAAVLGVDILPVHMPGPGRRCARLAGGHLQGRRCSDTSRSCRSKKACGGRSSGTVRRKRPRPEAGRGSGKARTRGAGRTRRTGPPSPGGEDGPPRVDGSISANGSRVLLVAHVVILDVDLLADLHGVGNRHGLVVGLLVGRHVQSTLGEDLRGLVDHERPVLAVLVGDDERIGRDRLHRPHLPSSSSSTSWPRHPGRSPGLRSSAAPLQQVRTTLSWLLLCQPGGASSRRNPTLRCGFPQQVRPREWASAPE